MPNILSPYDKFLTKGFIFTQSFVDYISSENLTDIEPWWFFCKSERAGICIETWCILMKEMYPTRNLVPFANWRYSDDIVCFDGLDKSGDPKVFFVHAFASLGWEDRGSVKNFEAWLKVAKEESAQYKADRVE